MSIVTPAMLVLFILGTILSFVVATHPRELKTLMFVIGNVVIGTTLVARRMLSMWWAEVVAKILRKSIMDTAKLQVRIDKMNDRINELKRKF